MDERKVAMLKASGFYPLHESTTWSKTYGDTSFHIDLEWDYDKIYERIRTLGWLPKEFKKPELPPQPTMQKIYFDAEFTGLHRESTLISIGFITDDDHTFYAEFTDFKERQVTPWIQENVINNLRFKEPCRNITQSSPPNPDGLPKSRYSIEMCADSKEIASTLAHWLTIQHLTSARHYPIQFITDCYAYDWMLLVDLLTNGKTALDMVEYLHYIPIDLSTLLYAAGVDPDFSREEFAGLGGELSTQEDMFNHITKSGFSSKKHNSLWDAFMIRACFNRIQTHKVPGDLSVISY